VSRSSAELSADRDAVDAALVRLGERYAEAMPAPVADAVRYALAGSGKRFRGLLLLMAYRACGGTGDATDVAAAIEVVHAYSLVHDDLPCMDDDDMRRGRPTVHRVHGTAAATVAGVVMVPLAVRAFLDATRALGVDGRRRADGVRRLMRASGAAGMVGGQLLDLRAEGRAASAGELERIHRGKTGALIAASASLGGMVAGASPTAIDALDRFGSAVGLAFQIADDVLDVTASTDALGKTAGRDIALQKSTYPALLGVDGALARARALIAEGLETLEAEALLTPELDRVARSAADRVS
jgi:geranylgeranyl pyrophosphate synthase